MGPRHRPTPDTNRFVPYCRDNRAELSTTLTVRINYRVLKPTTNPLRDAGWRVNKRKRRSKTGNNWTSTFNRATRQHGRHVYYSDTIKAIHRFTITVKKHKQGTTQIYNRIMQFTRQHLYNTTSQDWRHPQTFIQKPQMKRKSRLP